MPKYLQQFSFTAEGLKGLLKDGGSKRRAVIAEAVKSAGGKLVSAISYRTRATSPVSGEADRKSYPITVRSLRKPAEVLILPEGVV